MIRQAYFTLSGAERILFNLLQFDSLLAFINIIRTLAFVSF